MIAGFAVHNNNERERFAPTATFFYSNTDPLGGIALGLRRRDGVDIGGVRDQLRCHLVGEIVAEESKVGRLVGCASVRQGELRSQVKLAKLHTVPKYAETYP